jgi:hypothetical protein
MNHRELQTGSSIFRTTSEQRFLPFRWSTNPIPLRAMRFPAAPASRRAAAVSTNFGSPTSLKPLCGLRDLCAMLSPDSSNSRPGAAVSTNFGSPISLKSPSVASVTSVRCFSRFAQFSLRQPRCPPTSVRPSARPPLCGLCDLCAMLSPLLRTPTKAPCAKGRS